MFPPSLWVCFGYGPGYLLHQGRQLGIDVPSHRRLDVIFMVLPTQLHQEVEYEEASGETYRYRLPPTGNQCRDPARHCCEQP